MVSLCTIPNFLQEEGEILQSGVSIIDLESPDIFLKVEAIPEDIKSGSKTTVFFEMRNKHDFDLEDVQVQAFDTCVFSGESSETIGTLRASGIKTWTWSWTADQTQLDKDCVIKFKTEYKARNSIFQNIIVLSESEYQQRHLAGTLNNIPVDSSFPQSPFQINLRFSDPQPFIDDEKYYMYIDYNNVGGGYIDVNQGSIGIDFPRNTGGVSCSGYSGGSPITTTTQFPTEWGCCQWGRVTALGQEYYCEYRATEESCKYAIRWSNSWGQWYPNEVCCPGFENRCLPSNQCDDILPEPTQEPEEGVEANLLLEKEMNFINKKGSPTTCTFTALSSQPLSIESLRIQAQYTYTLENSINIKVKGM